MLASRFACMWSLDPTLLADSWPTATNVFVRTWTRREHLQSTFLPPLSAPRPSFAAFSRASNSFQIGLSTKGENEGSRLMHAGLQPVVSEDPSDQML